MGLFEITDEKLQMFYHKAWLAANRGYVDPKRYPDLDRALYIYAEEHGCSYNEALVFAKTGKKTGRLEE